MADERRDTTTQRRPRERRCASPSGAPCTSRSIRLLTSSRTRSAFGWPLPTRVGANDRTWIRTAHGGSAAGIVARARFVEDLVAEQAEHGVLQYVILGAGLDTFAQRRPELASRLRVFEVDQPARRPGSAGASSSSASVCRSGCGWCRSTSRGVDRGGAARRRPLRPRTAGRRRLDRRDPVPLQGGERRHAAPDRRTRPWVDARHDLPRAAGTGRGRPAAGIRGGRTRARGRRDTLHQLLHAGRNDGAGAPGRIPRGPHVSSAALNERYFAERTDGLRTARGEELLVATT